jgi:hypothetical protein
MQVAQIIQLNGRRANLQAKLKGSNLKWAISYLRMIRGLVRQRWNSNESFPFCIRKNVGVRELHFLPLSLSEGKARVLSFPEPARVRLFAPQFDRLGKIRGIALHHERARQARKLPRLLLPRRDGKGKVALLERERVKTISFMHLYSGFRKA